MLRAAGPIPAELGECGGLWLLDLSDNKLEGISLTEVPTLYLPLIPSFLRATTGMTVLTRANNQVCRP